MITIEVKGLKEVNRLLVRLPASTEKEVMSTSQSFMKFIQKSAKLRAPRFTGQLAESINVPMNRGNKEIVIQVTSPYAYFQEFGFTPHFLPAGMAVAGGYRILDWMQSKGLTGSGIMPSGQPQPFIGPAVEAGLNNLPEMLNQAIKQAIVNAK